MHYHSIEMSIILSVLENDHIGNDARIKDVELQPEYFLNPFHKKLVVGINRLKFLNLPICSDTMRLKFNEKNNWSYQEDAALVLIMTHTPFATLTLFESYYKMLKEKYFNSADKRLAI